MSSGLKQIRLTKIFEGEKVQKQACPFVAFSEMENLEPETIETRNLEFDFLKSTRFLLIFC